MTSNPIDPDEKQKVAARYLRETFRHLRDYARDHDWTPSRVVIRIEAGQESQSVQIPYAPVRDWLADRPAGPDEP